MRQYSERALAIALLLGALWIIDDTFQYWNAKLAMSTVQSSENKAAYRGSNLTLYFGTYITVAWNDNGLERTGEVRYTSFWNSRRLDPPYAGMSVPIVYVESKPHLARLASNHTRLWIMIVPLLLLSWLLWHGKIEMERGVM
jgi:hypothetical protein